MRAPPHIPQTIALHKAPPKWKRWDFLAWLVTLNGWETGAELGLWRGKTTAHLLSKCPTLRLVGVDLWAPLGDGGVYEDWDHVGHERGCREACAPFGDRLTIIKDWTAKAADKVPDASLDFVFIDADHTEKGAREDIAAWLPKVKATGWILGHDINWPGVRKAVDDLLPGYLIGPNVVWFRPVNPAKDWEADWR
jgi:predicted O-methyltransferase YrrM